MLLPKCSWCVKKEKLEKLSEMLRLHDIAACSWRATGHINPLPFSNGRSGENAAMHVRDYSPPQVRTQDGFVRRRNGFAGANLIQSAARIKRVSRHVPVVSIL